MWRQRACLLFFSALVLTIASCERLYALELLLLDRPVGTTRIVLTARLAGQIQPLDPVEVPGNQERIWLWLHGDSSGLFEVEAIAENADRCTLGHWRTSLDLPAGEQHSFRELPRQGTGQPVCPLTLHLVLPGQASGSVVVRAAGQPAPLLTCDSAECAPLYASGPFELSVQAGPNTDFVVWQGSCSGSQTSCTLSANRPQLVTAVFADRCSSDGFCPETFPAGLPPQNLNAVFGLDDSQVFMVGDGGTVLRWNGTQVVAETEAMDLLDASSALRNIDGSSEANEVWVVGEAGALLQHTAAGWTVPDPPTLSAVDYETVSVVKPANSAGVYVLIGSEAQIYRQTGGGAWMQSALPAPSVRSSHLAKSVEPNGVLHAETGNSRGGFFTYGGAGWSSVNCNALDGKTPTSLRSIVSDTGRDVLLLDVGGLWRAPGAGSTSPCTRLYAVPKNTSGSTDRLRRLGRADGQPGWIVGESGLLLRYDPATGAVTVTVSGTTKGLYGVWVSPRGAVWAVGAGGIILHRSAK